MSRIVWGIVSVGLFVTGAASLALTAYLWVGDWPAETKQLVEHLRSVAAHTGRAPDPLIGNVGARETRDLGGTWEAVIDPYGRGDLAGIAARAVEPRAPSDLAEFSYSGGLTLEVPGDWNNQDPRLVFYQGVVWYKREFDFTAPPGRRTFLYFGAANFRASVYLNGELLGEHVGGFTPFNFETTGRTRPGRNLLVVRVDNRMGDQDIPTGLTDWLNFGGLTREVLLVTLPETFIRNYAVQLADDGRIRGHVELDGPARDEVRVAIPELDVDAAFPVGADGTAEIEIEALPERWSPDSPRRYRVELLTHTDHVAEEIGFRRVEVRGGEILLNGEPIFLRGISIHEEADDGGRAHSEAHAETLLGWARELHCNFVRLAHYPHNEAMVRAADRLGLLVWAEIPVYWNVDFGNDATLAAGRRQLGELIARDQNRAAVIFWSLGNETPLSDARQAFMRDLADHVEATDPTRLTTAALLTGPRTLASFVGLHYLPALLGVARGTWTYQVGDPLEEIVDVPALNEYFGWYYSGGLAALTPFSSHYARRVMLDNMRRIRIRTGSDKPLVISELGAGALAGMRAPESELAVYSEEYQALVYREQIALIERQPQVRGLSPWILKDFRSPLRMYQGVQDYWNRKGLVASDGRRKLAFAVLRDYYRERAERDRS